MKNILFLDTETVGLPGDMSQPYTNHHNWPEMVSIAWLLCDKGETGWNEAEYIVAPRPSVFNTAAHINGITPEMQAEKGAEISLVLNALLENFDYADLVVCHNAAFDQPVLFAEMDRLGIEPPEIEWYCTKQESVELCRIPNKSSRYPGQYKWPSLDELHFFLFNEPIKGREQFHNALTDVRATARCYFEMQKRLDHTRATII